MMGPKASECYDVSGDAQDQADHISHDILLFSTCTSRRKQHRSKTHSSRSKQPMTDREYGQLDSNTDAKMRYRLYKVPVSLLSSSAQLEGTIHLARERLSRTLCTIIKSNMK